MASSWYARASFFGADLQRLNARIIGGVPQAPVIPQGLVEQREVLKAYIDRLLVDLDSVDAEALRSLRIGWDAGNGAAGPVIEALTARLPGEHHLLFTDVDGDFPHHHPDPTVETNLADLRALVVAKRLDFGVAFDGDADRIGLIDGLGGWSGAIRSWLFSPRICWGACRARKFWLMSNPRKLCSTMSRLAAEAPHVEDRAQPYQIQNEGAARRWPAR
jgi:hypothetical protein